MTIAKEFILAAERHKVVCEKLLAMPELKNLKPNKENIFPIIDLTIKQKQILADIYYLSGYIIECSCTAAIYSYYPDLHHKRNLTPIKKIKIIEQEIYISIPKEVILMFVVQAIIVYHILWNILLISKFQKLYRKLHF